MHPTLAAIFKAHALADGTMAFRRRICRVIKTTRSSIQGLTRRNVPEGIIRSWSYLQTPRPQVMLPPGSLPTETPGSSFRAVVEPRQMRKPNETNLRADSQAIKLFTLSLPLVFAFEERSGESTFLTCHRSRLTASAVRMPFRCAGNSYRDRTYKAPCLKP